MSTKTEHKIALAFEDGITKFIPCAEDQTVADAAYQAKINIPFDCRDGACGTCKAFCESGDFDEGEFVDDAMTQDELDDGFCLPCQAKPHSDMVLQIRTTSVLAKTGPETFQAEVTKVGALSDTVFELELEVEDRERLNFLPGQYVNITVPGSEETRSYSFATGPQEDKIAFLIKNTPNGLMTNWLKDVAKVGDKLQFEGPMGSFFLREPLQPVLLLAGGKAWHRSCQSWSLWLVMNYSMSQCDLSTARTPRWTWSAWRKSQPTRTVSRTLISLLCSPRKMTMSARALSRTTWIQLSILPMVKRTLTCVVHRQWWRQCASTLTTMTPRR